MQGAYNPGAQPQGAYNPGAQPQGAYNPGAQPQGAYNPGAQPQGAYNFNGQPQGGFFNPSALAGGRAVGNNPNTFNAPGAAGYLPSQTNQVPAYPQQPSPQAPLAGTVQAAEFLSDINTDCDFDSRQMKVTIKMTNGFTGQVFTSGYFGQPNCTSTGYGSNFMLLTVPMDGCGTVERPVSGETYNRNPGYTYGNTLIFMTLPYGILGTQDRAYTVQCQVKSDDFEQSSTNPLNVNMQVSNGRDPNAGPSNGLTVGEPATLAVIHRGSRGIWDVHLSNCYAHDGIGRSRTPLIGDDGCPAYEPEFVSPMKHGRLASGDLAHYFHFQAFKFPDKSNVYFQCTVDVCKGKCDMRPCNSSRRKRELSEKDSEVSNDETDINVIDDVLIENITAKALPTEKMLIYRGLTIILPGEQDIPLYWRMNYNVGDSVCVSRVTLGVSVGIVAVALLAAIISALLGIHCLRQKRELAERKQLYYGTHGIEPVYSAPVSSTKGL
ncbi:PREDICTED: uncharacterized protein LOC106810563 [Priapulus caudatus]|uniref:Uncharacterized protein LOC106810563 n=1 Tax=Priapulus caudatus TaxID=37621 RepID=A0ABM1EB64_PRICU|nr:PREDICTED: uncharacterized protein LOC106810563 [Priapulus caudatus]